MRSDDALHKSASCMSAGHCMTSCFNSHFSCILNWSKNLETNTSGQQHFCESVLGRNFHEWYNALAGKGLRLLCPTYMHSHSGFDDWFDKLHAVQRGARFMTHTLPLTVRGAQSGLKHTHTAPHG